MSTVKTAVSLDPKLNRFAESFARSHGMSKSSVFALALTRLQESTRKEKLQEKLRTTYANHELSEDERAWINFGSRTVAEALKDDKW